MNGAVSKVNKKFISHLTRAQRTPSAAAAVQVSRCATSSSLARAYCGAAGSVYKMAPQQEKAFCVLRFEVSRSVITVQREFRARFRKDAPQNGSHRKPFPAATSSWKLAPRPRSKSEKRTAGSSWETWTVSAADGVRCARVRWEINFLLTFETAPFYCVYPVFKVLMAVKTYYVVFWVIIMCALISIRLHGVMTHKIAVYN